MNTELFLAMSLTVSAMWLPYDTRISSPYPEYYASVRFVSKNTTVTFRDRNFADMLCAYAGYPVNAYYQAYNYTPLSFEYEATEERPIINSIQPLKNDYDSVIFALRQLESKVRSLSIFDKNNVNNITLGYLRSMNINYSDEPDESSEASGIAWRLLTGLQEPIGHLWNYIENRYAYHESVRNFFARYVDSEHYNSRDHWSIPSSVSSWGDLDDPIHSSDKGTIDLIHMFATIDGSLEYTNYDSTNTAGVFLGNNNVNKDLLGWGGNLQTIADLDVTKPEYDTFAKVLSSSRYFSLSNLLADMDGFCIAKLCDQGNLLSAAMTSYYENIKDSPSERYHQFALAMTNETTYPWDCSLSEKVRREAHALLGYKWISGDTYQDVYKSDELVYRLIPSGTDSQKRKKLVEMFSSYIIEKGEL